MGSFKNPFFWSRSIQSFVSASAVRFPTAVGVRQVVALILVRALKREDAWDLSRLPSRYSVRVTGSFKDESSFAPTRP